MNAFRVLLIFLMQATIFLAPSAALADPPTPPTPPEKWEFIGMYHKDGGPESINAVIDPDSITRDGNIVHAYVGRDFAQVDGQWTPGLTSAVASYEIDCKFHTYNELWFETFDPSPDFRSMPDKWITIEPDSDLVLAEKRVCLLGQ